MTNVGKGVLSGIAAYLIWGLSPLFWKLIHNVPATEIIGHRIVWSFVFIFVALLVKGDWAGLKQVGLNYKLFVTILVNGLLLSINWLVYIYAVNSDLIVDASLGYFINPLMNVVMGVVFFRERLRVWQWIPVCLAGLGVLYLTIQYGSLPWIGLVLAFSFGFYGLLKKKSKLTSLHGFSLEMGVLLFPALAFLGFLSNSGEGVFNLNEPIDCLLLILTGIVTGIPLLLFGAAVKSVHLSTLGFIQYIAPTLQFLIGVLIFGEPFSMDRMIGFGFIWFAIVVYSGEGLLTNIRINKKIKFVQLK